MSLNPEILTWARNTAGLSPDQAARALGFKDTHDRSAEERLTALEAGDEEPSRSVLLRMAKAYRRSLLVFYLSEPPPTGDRGQDFRTVRGAPPPQFDPVLDAFIRDIRGRQAIVRGLVEEGEPEPVDFIGSASMNDSPRALANQISDRLRFSLVDFRTQATVDLAFSHLREQIEASGVYVLLLGNLGSHHTNIPVGTFRGFAVADPMAPFVVINDQDARAAWSFTALHEVAHLWLGTTGISGSSAEATIERYCNDVAGEILLPETEVTALTGIGRQPLAEAIEAVSTFARARKLSRAMVAYKLMVADLISKARWQQLTEHFRQEWVATRNRQKEAERDNDGGPSYYVVRRHRLGDALLGIVRRSLGEGILTYTKAAQVLGVKPRNVDLLLHGAPEHGGR
jgi:Zn-dependent peptidase ImmA (M78 family)